MVGLLLSSLFPIISSGAATVDTVWPSNLTALTNMGIIQATATPLVVGFDSVTIPYPLFGNDEDAAYFRTMMTTLIAEQDAMPEKKRAQSWYGGAKEVLEGGRVIGSSFSASLTPPPPLPAHLPVVMTMQSFDKNADCHPFIQPSTRTIAVADGGSSLLSL
jgi:hypothetical protein